ncbi:hypothetical protein EB72_16580 [Mycobacterium sp. SWH-M1]|nr:hypothetical protein EB72_16580 [Mycobacterium sp. SWH-M1]
MLISSSVSVACEPCPPTRRAVVVASAIPGDEPTPVRAAHTAPAAISVLKSIIIHRLVALC